MKKTMQLNEIKTSFDIDKKFNEALRCHQAGQLHEAEKIYGMILALSPEHSDSLHHLGFIAYQTGQHDIAVDLIERAIRCNPENPLYHVNLGLVYHALGWSEKAITCYKKVLHIESCSAEACNGIGNVFHDQKNYQKAVFWYRKATEIKPDWAEVYFNTGKAYKDQENYERALFYYRNALKLKPDMVDACYNIGNIYLNLRKYDEAIPWYEKVLVLKPGMIQAYYNLGKTYNEIGELDLAEACCSQALSIQPDYMEAWLLLVIVHIMQPQSGKCRTAIDDALNSPGIQENQKNWLLTQKAIISWLYGDFKQTVDFLRRAMPGKQEEAYNTLDKSTTVYQEYLSLLADFYINNPGFYADKEAPKVYMAGDSHSLGFARTKLMINDTCFTVESKLVMGAKAYHFVTDVNNQYKHAFYKIIEEISENSTMIAAFGEIDCRPDGGIYPSWKNRFRDRSLEDMIEETVSGYVNFIVNASKQKRLKLLFYGVPAPLQSQTAGMSEQEISEYIQIPRLFNKHLKLQALAIDCQYIDVYSMTDSGNGFSNERFHMDGYHLYPSVLSMALENVDAAD